MCSQEVRKSPLLVLPDILVWTVSPIRWSWGHIYFQRLNDVCCRPSRLVHSRLHARYIRLPLLSYLFPCTSVMQEELKLPSIYYHLGVIIN